MINGKVITRLSWFFVLISTVVLFVDVKAEEITLYTQPPQSPIEVKASIDPAPIVNNQNIIGWLAAP